MAPRVVGRLADGPLLLAALAAVILAVTVVLAVVALNDPPLTPVPVPSRSVG